MLQPAFHNWVGSGLCIRLVGHLTQRAETWKSWNKLLRSGYSTNGHDLAAIEEGARMTPFAQLAELLVAMAIGGGHTTVRRLIVGCAP